MFLDEAERCKIPNHFHSFKMLKALIKVVSALNVVKIYTVQVKLILTVRNIIQNWYDIWKYENINSVDLEIIITHTARLLSLLSDFKKSESRIKLALTSMSNSKEVKEGYKTWN